MLEGCGELYCPWETFKQIALENVDFDCIQQPLKDSIESLYAESTSVPTDGGDGDDDDSLDTWLLIGITVAACTLFFLVVQVVVFQYQKKKHAAQADDVKQGLMYN